MKFKKGISLLLKKREKHKYKHNVVFVNVAKITNSKKFGNES